MRKSKAVILSIFSVFGVALTVTATYAAWAIKDDAAPFAFTVTIGDHGIVKPDAGYYLTFESDGYLVNGEHTVKMTDTDIGLNLAEASNISVPDGSQVRIYHYDGATIEDVDVLTTYSIGTEHGYASLGADDSTITFNTARSGNTFSFYLNGSNELYISDETYKTYSGYYVTYEASGYSFASATRMDDVTGSNVAEKSIALSANQKFRIEHFNGERGIISSPKAQGATYSHFTKSSYEDTTIQIKIAGTYKLMLSAETDKLYISNPSLVSNNGYFIYPSTATDYADTTNRLALVERSGDLGAYYDFTVTAGQKIKLMYADYENDSSTTYTQGSNSDLLNSVEGDTVIEFKAAGRYDIYLNSQGKIYVDQHKITVTFTINYGTNWGESIYMLGNFGGEDCWSVAKGKALTAINDSGDWAITISELPGTVYEFKFTVVKDGNVTRWETDPNRTFTFTESGTESFSWR